MTMKQSIGWALLAGVILMGSVTIFEVGDGTITTAKVADGAITQAKLSALTSAKLDSTGSGASTDTLWSFFLDLEAGYQGAGVSFTTLAAGAYGPIMRFTDESATAQCLFLLPIPGEARSYTNLRLIYDYGSSTANDSTHSIDFKADGSASLASRSYTTNAVNLDMLALSSFTTGNEDTTTFASIRSASDTFLWIQIERNTGDTGDGFTLIPYVWGELY